MSWVNWLGMNLTKPIAENSAISSALNAGQRTLGDRMILEKLQKMNLTGPLGELANKLKMYDEKGNVSLESIGKGLMNVPAASVQVLEKSKDAVNLLEKGAEQLRKVPLVGGAIATAIEAPLEETKKAIDVATDVGKEISSRI